MEFWLHHVQVSGPAGCEDAMRAFYAGVLGMTEVDEPERLRARGGVWFRAGSAEVHDAIPGLRRFHTTDPVGNRLEFQQARESQQPPSSQRRAHG